MFRIVPIEPPPAASTQQDIYREVAAAIDDADLLLLLDLRAGVLELKDKSTVDVAPDTQAEIAAVVKDGMVVSGMVNLTRRLTVTPIECVPLSFRQLRVDSTGEVDPVDLRFECCVQQALLSGLQPRIRDAIKERLAINPSVTALLNGNLFAATSTSPTVLSRSACERSRWTPIELVELASWNPILAGGAFLAKSARPASVQASQQEPDFDDLIERVRVRIPHASLRPGTVFRFGDVRNGGPLSTTHVVVGRHAIAAIPFAQLTKDNALTAVIDLDIETLESTIRSKGQRIDFGTGSTLIASRLRFQRQGASWAFETDGGYAELRLKTGDFAIEHSDLRLGQDSTLALIDLKLRGSDHAGLALEGTVRLDFELAGGSFTFNNSHLALDPGGRLRAEGTFYQITSGGGIVWRVQGLLSELDLVVRKGDFDLERAGHVSIASGSRLTVRNAHFDTAKKWSITGTVEILKLAAMEGRLNIAPNSHVLLAANSTLTLSNVTIAEQSPHFVGTLATNLQVAGGILHFTDHNVFNLQERSGLTATSLRLNSSAENPMHGEIDEIRCTLSSGGVQLGRDSRISLSTGTVAVARACKVPQSGSRILAQLELDARVFSGLLALGSNGHFTVGESTRLRCVNLQLDTAASIPLVGVIDQIVFLAADGALRIPGASSFMSVRGRVEFTPLVLSAVVDEMRGHGIFDIQYAGGTWNAGTVNIKLLDGHFNGFADWSPEGAPQKVAAHVIRQRSGLAVRGPADLAIERIDVEITDADSIIPTGNPAQLMLHGNLAIYGTGSISANPSFPVEKTGEVAKLSLLVPGGWRLSGTVTYDSEHGLDALLDQSAGQPVRLKLDHVSDGGKVHLWRWSGGCCNARVWWNNQNDIPNSIDRFSARFGSDALVLWIRVSLPDSLNVDFDTGADHWSCAHCYVGELLEWVARILVDERAVIRRVAEGLINSKLDGVRLAYE